MNQTSCAGSPQPQVSVDDGWPDQTCHHSTTAGTVKQAMATTWKPTARRARDAAARPGPSGGSACSARRGRSSVGAEVRRTVWRCRGVSCTGASTRPSRSSLPPSVLPAPSWRRGHGRRAPVPMIVAVPDDRRCIVVGAGLLGLSAAWALSRRGWQWSSWRRPGAVGHDRPAPRATRASSGSGYPEPHYVEMAVRARALWRDLETRRRTSSCSTSRGQVTFGDEARSTPSPPRWRRRVRRPSGCRPARPRARFPGIASTGVGALRTRIGRAGRRRLPARAAPGGRLRGADRHAGSRRCASGPTPSRSRPRTGTTFEADVVVDCAGPRALGLLGGATAGRGARRRSPRWPISARVGRRTPVPVFIEWGDDMIYGLPVPGGGPHARHLQGVPPHARPALERLRPRRPGAARPTTRRSSPC